MEGQEEALSSSPAVAETSKCHCNPFYPSFLLKEPHFVGGHASRCSAGVRRPQHTVLANSRRTEVAGWGRGEAPHAEGRLGQRTLGPDGGLVVEQAPWATGDGDQKKENRKTLVLKSLSSGNGPATAYV